VIKGKKDKIYILKKIKLYGQKKTPKTSYKKIDSYFVKNDFQISLSKHTLYFKFIKPIYTLIVCIYIDYLIFY